MVIVENIPLCRKNKWKPIEKNDTTRKLEKKKKKDRGPHKKGYSTPHLQVLHSLLKKVLFTTLQCYTNLWSKNSLYATKRLPDGLQLQEASENPVLQPL